jgi:hypothetical protein
MGASEFKAWRESLGISREKAAEVAFLLFAKEPQQLTDSDRGQLRDELAGLLTEQATA